MSFIRCDIVLPDRCVPDKWDMVLQEHLAEQASLLTRAPSALSQAAYMATQLVKEGHNMSENEPTMCTLTFGSPQKEHACGGVLHQQQKVLP
jgi:hypothetical protein